MGEYEPNDSRDVTLNEGHEPGGIERTGPREDEAREEARKGDDERGERAAPKPMKQQQQRQQQSQSQQSGADRPSHYGETAGSDGIDTATPTYDQYALGEADRTVVQEDDDVPTAAPTAPIGQEAPEGGQADGDKGDDADVEDVPPPQPGVDDPDAVPDVNADESRGGVSQGDPQDRLVADAARPIDPD
jgi:hypothetical protein